MKKRPKPFDLILVSDVDRIARDTKILLDFFALMKTHEVPVYFVNQQLDSTHPHFDLSINIVASYIEALSRKMKTAWKNLYSSLAAQRQAK